MMMKKSIVVVSAFLFCLVLAATPATAGSKTVTLEGKIVCAKCALHLEDQEKCQNVLVVDNGKGKEKHYFLTKNDVYEEQGDVCMAKPQVVVTGTVSKQDGQRWLTASEMKPLENEG